LTFSAVFLNKLGISQIGADKNQKRLAILNQRKYVSKLTTLKNERKGIKMQTKSEIIDTIRAKIFILTSLKFIYQEIFFFLNLNEIYVKNIYKIDANKYPGSHLKKR